MSVAVQLIVVEPTGNRSGGAEQLTVTGARPPDACGWESVTGTGLPSADWVSMRAGHEIVSGSGVGGTGPGESPQPVTRKSASAARAERACRRALENRGIE